MSEWICQSDNSVYFFFGSILRLAFFRACSKSRFVNGVKGTSAKPESIVAAGCAPFALAVSMILRRMSFSSGP